MILIKKKGLSKTLWYYKSKTNKLTHFLSSDKYTSLRQTFLVQIRILTIIIQPLELFPYLDPSKLRDTLLFMGINFSLTCKNRDHPLLFQTSIK